VLPDTVLLVDDEAIVLDVLTVALQKKGLAVKTAGRVADALTLLQAEPFGCMLVDKNLPDGSGLDLIKRTRELQPLCACIVITGYPNVDSILQALRLGAVDYLEKPFPQMSLVQEKVVHALAHQRVVAEHQALVQRVKVLQAERPKEDFASTAQVAMLQNALDVLKADHERALREVRESLQAEVDAATGRLDAVKFRHQKTMAALRQGAALLANLLDSHALPAEVDRDLRELRRALTQVLDEG
jgi:YesN/AraC family two-component response regulator